KGGAFGESEDDYKKLLASYLEALQPVGGFEEFLVEKLAFLALRVSRIYKADAKIAPLFFEGIRKSLAAGPSFYLMGLQDNDKDGQLTPELLVRYEGTLERQFDRTLSQLERVQRARLGQFVPPPLKVELST